MSAALDARSSALSSILPDGLDGLTPIAVRPIDIESEMPMPVLPRSPDGRYYRRLLALLRRDGLPLGWVVLPVFSDGTVSPDALDAAISAAARVDDPPDERAEFDGGTRPILSEDDLRAEHAVSRSVTEPLLSIVVATCADGRSVLRCVEAIRSSACGAYEVIVVENRPQRSTVKRELQARFGADETIRFIEELRPGLSAARNAGLRAARGEIVAFTDDDVLVDRAWVSAIRAAFSARPDVGCVTGLILPLEMEKPSQLLVEQYASYGKGFLPRIYSLDQPPPDQPLFPYTAGYFGSGANLAFRTAELRALGEFDEVLGTGTRARGGEDLDICIRLLHAGGSLLYEPRAMVWHRHHETLESVRRGVFDCGAGLGAMFTKQILTGPAGWQILSRVPRGLRYYTNPKSRKNAARGAGFPASLGRLERAGLLYGPLAYLTSRLLPQG